MRRCGRDKRAERGLRADAAGTAPGAPGASGGARRGRWLAAVLTAAAGVAGLAQTTQPAGPAGPSGALRDLAGLVAAALTGGGPAAGAGAPVRAAPPDGNAVTLTDTGLLDLHVRDMDIATVLELLSYKARANIVTTTSVTGRVSANLYDVTLEQALAAVLTPSQYAFWVTGNTVFVGKPEELASLRPPPETRVFRLRYLRADEAATAVRAAVSAGATIVVGGERAGAGAGGSAAADEMPGAGVDYLVVTDHPSFLDAAAKLLAELDRRPRQVLIEATVLRATLNEANQLGIDFTMLCGVDFQNVGSTSRAAADLTTGPLPAGAFQHTTVNTNTDFSANVIGGGLTFGLIKDSIGVFLRALEEVTDVVVVANPKIVALNKQQAEVIVGRRDGYLTTTVTETAAVQTVEFLETGTQIKFRPLINDDDTVRLVVHPKDSNGGLTAANLPFEETTEAHADILVRDGDTVLIGGLFRERTVSSRAQIPLLGDVPVVGVLFGSRDDQTIREEVIILLTVHILKETDAERAAWADLAEDIERVRVGSRAGLLGLGRERLAQAHYHEALRQLERGELERALLNVRMTLHNQPKHLDAIKLREQLLQQRFWDAEGTRMRTFIDELIAAERSPVGAAPAAPFDRPRPHVPGAAPPDGGPVP